MLSSIYMVPLQRTTYTLSVCVVFDIFCDIIAIIMCRECLNKSKNNINGTRMKEEAEADDDEKKLCGEHHLLLFLSFI